MRHAALMLLVAALTLLTACSGQTEPPEPFGVPAATPPATTLVPASLTPEQEQLFGPRVELPGGLLLKQLGKVAQWSDTEVGVEDWDVRVVLDSIEVDPQCDEFTPAPERGHRLLLSLRVETGPEYNQTLNGVPQYYEWSTIGLDGVSEAPTSTGYSCRQADELPYEMRPSAKYRGTVSVDTANPAGHLVLNNQFAWNYPA